MRAPAILLLLLPVILAGWLFAALTAPWQDEIRKKTSRTSALRAEAATLRSRLSEFEHTVEVDAFPSEVLFQAKTASEAALTLQSKLVQIAGQHQLVLSSFGDIPPPQDLASPAVAVVLEGEGETEAVAHFLAALEALTPRVGVSQLSMRELPRRRSEVGSAPVALRLVVWGFWAEQDI